MNAYYVLFFQKFKFLGLSLVFSKLWLLAIFKKNIADKVIQA